MAKCGKDNAKLQVHACVQAGSSCGLVPRSIGEATLRVCVRSDNVAVEGCRQREQAFRIAAE